MTPGDGLPRAAERFPDSPRNSSDAHAGAIRDEQIRLFYQYLPVLGGLLLAGAGLVVVLWGVASRAALLAWYAALVAAVGLRGFWYWQYHRPGADRSHARWATYAVVGVLCTGGVWGIGAVLLFPAESIEYQLFILLMLVGLTAGGVTSLSAYLPAFYVFLPVAVVPMNVFLLLQPDRFHRMLGAMGFVYVAALALFGRTIGRSVLETLKLRFEKNDLIAELSRKKDEAERANIAKSKFLAAASHDLRQPLHALTLFTSTLDERNRYPEIGGIVANIKTSVQALEKLFNALLDISRLDAGVLRPERAHVRLATMLERLEREYAPDARAKGLALQIRGGDHVVYTDPALLERILRNYISNAIRYTEAGVVTVEAVAADGALRIDVVDTGIGIPAAHHREIFDEFHQLGNSERDRTKGLGLGLAIVDRVARLLGHPIGVDSAPGRGSRFWVIVPAGDEHAMARDSEEVDGSAYGDLSGLRVVVIDDEAAAREAMRLFLEQRGCVAVLAGSEDEALARLLGMPRAPDAIIADYRLRDGRNGIEAIERLRAQCGRRIPAHIVTGDTAPERLREAKAGGHQLAHKPVSPATLRAFLGHVRRRAPVPKAVG